MNLLYLTLIIFPCLLRLSYTDIKNKELENIFILLILPAAFFTQIPLTERLISLILPIVLIGLMGIGDVMLFSVLGFVFGFKDLIFITLLSSALAGIISAIKLITKKIGAKDSFPFAPYISFSVVVLLIKQGAALWTK